MKVDYFSLNINNSINTLKTIKIENFYYKQIKITILMEEALPTHDNNLTLSSHKVVNVATPKNNSETSKFIKI